MKIKGIITEDFINYKKPSMIIMTNTCDLKCDNENGNHVCQNSELMSYRDVDVDIEKIAELYLDNPITESVVFSGLEPMLQFDDVIEFVRMIRCEYHCDDDIVIYTGYYIHEVMEKIHELSQYKNIVVKFGRFIPGHEKHYDEVLGVELSSDNQYALKIS